jgi:hypothetical protein
MRVIGADFKAGINAFLLLLGSLASHFAGGGSFIAPSRLIVEGAMIFALLFACRYRFLAGPQLALIIVLTQSAGHLILGQASNANSVMMSSHILGGLISYIAVSRSEAFWMKLSEISFTFGLALPRQAFVPVFINSPRPHHALHFLNLDLLISPVLRRGPPRKLSSR